MKVEFYKISHDTPVVYTGNIPQCPYCQKPTKRIGGSGSVTNMVYPPMYDENGVNTNPDRNTITSNWACLECEKKYTTSGNKTEGFVYEGVISKDETK
jgi:hypothetical protein